jgi:hypothetical protein
MFNIGERIQIEQAMTEVRLNLKPFPDCFGDSDISLSLARRQSDGRWQVWVACEDGVKCLWKDWDELPLNTRIGIVAVALQHDHSGAALIIHKAYMRLCKQK